MEGYGTLCLGPGSNNNSAKPPKRRAAMVACDFGGVSSGKRQGMEGWHRMQMLIVGAVAFVTLVVATVTISLYGNSGFEMEQVTAAKSQKLAQAATFDQLSGDLLNNLEQSMDRSVDKKVKAHLARQTSLAEISGAMGYHRISPYDSQPYVTQTQLEQLVSEKRDLETKRESILRSLRMRREAAAAKAAKDAAELDEVRLERAVALSKKRQLEQAQREARAAAARMREAAIARRMALHAAAVAESRQKELEAMSLENTQQAMHVAKMEDIQDAAEDMQYQQDKSVVDAKLKKYLAKERDLLHKIAATEKVAAHGGVWPSQGIPKTIDREPASAPLSQSLRETSSSASHRASRRRSSGRSKHLSVEGEVIDSLVETIKQNKRKLSREEGEEKALTSRAAELGDKMRDLRSTDRRLAKELVHAELSRAQ